MTTPDTTARAVTYTIPGRDPLRFDLERFSHRQVVDETRGGDAVLMLVPTLAEPPRAALALAARLDALCRGDAEPDLFRCDGHEVDKWLMRPHAELLAAGLEPVSGVFGFTGHGDRALLVLGIVPKTGQDVRILAPIDPGAVFATV
jgi:hypothetical protein